VSDTTSHRVSRIFRDLGLGGDDRSAWHATGLPEEDFDAWITDRVARRPSGPRA
jgi:hypothetical protein